MIENKGIVCTMPLLAPATGTCCDLGRRVSFVRMTFEQALNTPGMILEDKGFVYAPPEWFPGAQELIDRKPELAAFRDEVRGAWERLKNHDFEGVDWRPDNPLDIHLGKLYAIRTYLAEREQLRNVPTQGRTTTTAAPPVP